MLDRGAVMCLHPSSLDQQSVCLQPCPLVVQNEQVSIECAVEKSQLFYHTLLSVRNSQLSILEFSFGAR
jgi:hypothetical protein